MSDLIESLNQAINLPITEPVTAPAPAAPAAPATPDPYAEYLAGIAPELHSLVRPALEAARTKWEGESAPQRQTAEQMQAFAQAMGQNPRGMLAFLAQHYNVPFADPTTTAPAPAGPQPTAPSEVETIKRELLSIPRDAPPPPPGAGPGAPPLKKPLAGEVRRLRGQPHPPAVNEARAQVAGPTS